MIGKPEVHGAKVTHVANRRSPWVRGVAGLVALAATAGACSAGGGDERGLEALDTPQFAPEDATTGGSTVTTRSDDDGPPVTSPTTGPPAAAPDAGPVDPADPTTAAEPRSTPDRQDVTIDDPVGDATGGLDDDPPPWSDLAGATLTRTGDAFGLSIRLGGGTPPDRSDGRSSMNVATFFDIDGDGTVDYEIWANLGPQGWGAAWYDNVNGGGGFGEDSNVTVNVLDDSVLLIFPDVLVAGAEQFRFSLASEYGELDVLGTDFARRDDAPDDGQVVRFPS